MSPRDPRRMHALLVLAYMSACATFCSLALLWRGLEWVAWR